MITQFRHKHLTWIDIQDPTPEDVATIIKDFEIQPSWGNELLKPSERAKTDTISNTFYAVLHYPDHPSMVAEGVDIEIDYIVGHDYVITAHYSPIDTFTELAKEFEIGSTLGRDSVESGGELFLALNNHLYRGLREELEPLRKESRKIEAGIFHGHEFTMVHEISHLGRRLLDFRQALRSHKTILNSLQVQAPKLFPHTPIEEDHIFREYIRVENALENIRELLWELRETNDSLLTAKNNDVTKKLTLMAFVTFPLTLVAEVLEFRASPQIFQGPTGFWVIVGTLVVLLLMMQLYFNYKKWI